MGRILSVPLGASWYLSAVRAVSHCLHDSIGTHLPYPPKGMGRSQEVLKQSHFFPSIIWGECSGGKSVQPHHNVGTPLPSQGFYHRGEWLSNLPCWCPLGLTGSMPCCSLMGTPTMCPPTEGHLSIMVDGSTSSVPCGRIYQLEVHQLLSLGSKVDYPEGLNGCQVPVITSLPELLSKGMTMLKGESASLQLDILQSAAKGQESKAHPLAATEAPFRLQAWPGPFLPKWKGKSAWPWRWVNAYPWQC